MSSETVELLLYTRPQCHLCDIAAAMLEDLGVSWRKQNIESDLGLIARYGSRIPVLVRASGQQELDWPFAPDDVRELIGDRS